MRLKLNRLVLITCMALLGIIALQVFWLFKAYREQETQLFSIADNAMMETQLFAGVSSSLNATAKSFATSFLDEYTHEDGNLKVKDTQKTKAYNINVKLEAMQEGDSDLKREILKMIGLDSSGAKSYTLQAYKAKLKKALEYKKVNLPFELALVDLGGAITACTIDTSKFKGVSMKTAIDYGLPVTLNKKQSGRVQLAFPGATFYLLKGMAFVLLLSLCLTIVCAFSFSYMVALFYKQKKVAEIRNDFMNNMTHELKTPISSVSVALELLQDESVTVGPEVRQEYFKIASNELERLTMLVDKVLKMSAFERMEVVIKPEWLVVESWINEVVHSIRPLTEIVKTRIDVWVDPLSLQLWADKGHMSSALQNLLENAIKYADKNKPYLQININATADESNVYIKVIDNGIGIQEQYQTRVFDKFFRVPNGDKHDTKGYGLGLSYVNEIVRLHRGEIQLISEWKRGTAFTIRIPKNN